MTEVLTTFERISLEEMKGVRLMNRIDTKYVTTLPVLLKLLELAQGEYMVQETDGKFNMPYHTMYFDTQSYKMYMEHLHGKKTRQKIRVRTYENSGVSFLEIKNKNNKGRTKKKRIPYAGIEVEDSVDFIGSNSLYNPVELHANIENRFSRVTLVNRNMTERLTVDTALKFNNHDTGNACRLDELVIIELKRDGLVVSPVLEMLRKLRVQPAKFSKYCMGLALTDENLKQNRFKPRLRYVKKMCNLKVLDERQFYM